ncbi:histidine phosphatase family protein [Thiomicrorhabdus sp. 6S3-12]|uniref:histidine phosphatase family protein n=1 Tax=Thiomicrorhabdus sp. 6S3-12 TaxID=2819681 RepID=UPI001AADC177|nr:histidine phosphatase family protein [Thiomicrorhabdus sp. 6S3-12]MBO1924706.1 histidine phosphatase family protein [Thiomicrorhabdus sp. 6S3-12]
MSSIPKTFRHFFWLFFILFPISYSLQAHSAKTNDNFNEIIATPQLLKKLQNGGYVLYMRHGNTDNSRPDRVPAVDLNDCNTQRVLNQKGIEVTTQVGNYVRQAQIPVGDVFASPMCRAKNSAKNAFQNVILEPGLMYTGSMTSEEKKPVIAKTRSLISTPVKPGKNRILVAHAPNMMDLIGYFPEEATLVIFLPKGDNQFEYLGSIRPGDWPKLLGE